MKNLFYFLLFFVFTTFTLAQTSIPAGTFNLGGSLSFSSTSNEGMDDNTNLILLSPQGGYFFVDNLSANLKLEYSNTSLGGQSSTQLGIGPGLRYYIPAKTVFPFIDFSFLYDKRFNSVEDDTWILTQYIIAGGVDYFITESVALESLISYSFENTKLPSSYSGYYSDLNHQSNTLRIGVGLNIFLK